MRSFLIRFVSLTLAFSLSFLPLSSISEARFISPDTANPTIPGVGTNRYAYGENDPINKSDPNGHIAVVDDALELGLGLATVAVAAYSYTAADYADDGHLNGSLGKGFGTVLGESFRGLTQQIGGLFSTEAEEPENSAKAPSNPYGAKGKEDHQAKVKELEAKALEEALPGQKVDRETKIGITGSNRRPDVQTTDENGVTISVKEAERNPNGKRNREREAEYDRLGIKNETYGVGSGAGKGKSDGGGREGTPSLDTTSTVKGQDY